jgi:hypothetical protein
VDLETAIPGDRLLPAGETVDLVTAIPGDRLLPAGETVDLVTAILGDRLQEIRSFVLLLIGIRDVANPQDRSKN